MHIIHQSAHACVHTHILRAHDKIIEQVSSLRYPGIQITSHQDLQGEVKHQAIKTSRISGCLDSSIC